MKVRVLVAAAAGRNNIWLGYLIYGILLVSYLHDNLIQYPDLNKEPPDFIPLVLSDLVMLFYCVHF